MNTQEVNRSLVNPNSLIPFSTIGLDPNSSQLPLQRCAGDCDIDAHCMPGLFCMRDNPRYNRVPGCNGVTQNQWNYCVDINDFDYGFMLLPTAGWTEDWHMSKSLRVNLTGEQAHADQK